MHFGHGCRDLVYNPTWSVEELEYVPTLAVEHLVSKQLYNVFWDFKLFWD